MNPFGSNPRLRLLCLLFMVAMIWTCGEGPTQPGTENDPPDTIITQKSLLKVPLGTDSTGAVINLELFIYTIEYTALDLDSKVDSFQVKINNGDWSAFSSKTTNSDTLEFDSQSVVNTVSVRAKDNGGQVDPTPATAEFRLSEIEANASPTTAFEVGPTDGATTSSGVQFVVVGTDADGAVVEFSYSLDGAQPTRLSADAEGKAKIEFSESAGNRLALGNHSLSVQAIDNLGAVDETPETRSFFVSAGFDPIIRFQAGPADGGGWFSNVDVSFAFSAELAHYSGSLLGFSWAFDDSSAGAFTEFSLSGSAMVPGADVIPGEHFFILRAKDLAGSLTQAKVSFTAATASLDAGIIIIDDCGFGENETLEAIFAAAGHPVSRFWDFDGDVAHPKDDLSIWTPGELGKYSSVVIFTDNSPTASANEILLGAYVKAGGNLWLTSYNWSVFGAGFLEEIGGIVSVFNNFEAAGITGVNDSWDNPWGNTVNSSFDGITIDFTGSISLVDIIRPGGIGEAIFQATEGSFPAFPRGVYMPHPAPWGKVVSWGHSLRRTAADDPALQAAAAVILGTFFGE